MNAPALHNDMAQGPTIGWVRRLDLDRTPQELQPAKVPSLLIFSLGTLAWVAVLLVLGARNVLGYGADVRIASVAIAGVLLGLGGMLWARLRGQREGSATGVPEMTTASAAPVTTAAPVAPASPEPASSETSSTAHAGGTPTSNDATTNTADDKPTSSTPTGTETSTNTNTPASHEPAPPEPEDQP